MSATFCIDTADCSMAEWREILTWLAMHGVNLPVSQVYLEFEDGEVTFTASIPVEMPIPSFITNMWSEC